MTGGPAHTVGERVGPYEIQALVGRGGMGEVYRAADTRLGRTVALKFVYGADAGRLAREARAVAALNHPHICTLYDAGPNYLVMEYVDGQPLRGPIAPALAVRYARQTASALQAAHARGIVHRDLKPANILVTDAGIKLLDFGVARMVGLASDGAEAPTATVTSAGTIVGTAAYMAPEQASGGPVDARSDLFALGAVLYEVLSGRSAFERPTFVETLGAILHDEPDPIDAPPGLRGVVVRCLRKRPAERYQSATDLIGALDRVDAAGEAPTRPSIAVLPFANFGGDRDDDYFGDGLAEEILNALARTPGLQVTARTSSFAFRGRDEDVRAIGETLGVGHVLEGSVRRAGRRIRVTAQLINAADGYHLWSERFDRELTDVFAVQDEIAAAISDALRLKLVPKPPAPARYRPALPAYDAFLEGRHLLLEIRDRLPQAVDAFARSIALDPGYAEPHLELASCHVLLWYFGLERSGDAAAVVRDEVQAAAGLGRVTPRGEALRGIVSAAFDYDWAHAERQFAASLAERHGAEAEARWCYATFWLAPFGRFAEAIALVGESVQADPLNVAWRTSRAHLHGLAGDHTAVIDETREILARDSSQWIAHLYGAEANWATGQTSKALALIEAGHRLVPWHARTSGMFAALLDLSGERVRADEIVGRLTATPDAPGAATGLVVHAVMTGDIEAAARWWARAIDQRDLWVIFNARAWFTRELRASPHWPALAARMGLPSDAASA